MLKAILGLIITSLINPLMLVIGLTLLVIGLTYGLVAEQISENFLPSQIDDASIAINESLKKLDTDNDSLTDYEEIYDYKTNPESYDTDADGYPDGVEIGWGFNPLSDVEKIVIEEPREEVVNLEKPTITISGTASPLIQKLELAVSREDYGKRVLELERIKKTEIVQKNIKYYEPTIDSGGAIMTFYSWSQTLEANDDNLLMPGENKLEIKGYDKAGITTTRERTVNFAVLAEETGLIEVNWYDELTKVVEECKADYCEYEYFLAGEIKTGNHKGEKLYLEVLHSLGDSFSHYLYQNGVQFYLDRADIKIKGIDDLPEKIDWPGKPGYTLKKYYVGNLFSKLKIEKKVFTDETLGDFYLSGGCLVTELPDHTAIAYDLQLPFTSKDITFNDGIKSKDDYDYHRISGCSALCHYFAEVDVEMLKPEERLEVAGKTNTGETFYEIKDPQDKTLRALFNEDYTFAAYKGKNEAGDPYTYEEFLALHPLLYWKDPMGRWIEFKNTKYATMAEMCKPVIYLYPEEETELKVKVEPNGGFTGTEPAYKDGWQVRVKPDGQVTDITDGKVYDYLYWEGWGLNYPVLDRGWVVEREKLDEFFSEKLGYIGLNEKEIADFEEYWLERLDEKPYYQLSFLQNREFDELAPLKISPETPKNILRVMMTARGRDEFKKIEPQELWRLPTREGFTVIEWGGTLFE